MRGEWRCSGRRRASLAISARWLVTKSRGQEARELDHHSANSGKNHGRFRPSENWKRLFTYLYDERGIVFMGCVRPFRWQQHTPPSSSSSVLLLLKLLRTAANVVVMCREYKFHSHIHDISRDDYNPSFAVGAQWKNALATHTHGCVRKSTNTE